ncbi:hypothetical protein GCM10011394_17860 [Luteimonas terricola]|uniref:Uncharacterized protein n=1 Tax=Luteimonas terricola TaxID=645597 RepID=A0ABQ2EEC0_9GAMM|nr:hypothetical protein GCM10011394_17860 [Luteimonas terricola]
MPQMESKFASRKFILAAFVLLAALGLLIAGLIDQNTWSSFNTWVIGLYITGNVGAAYVADGTGYSSGGYPSGGYTRAGDAACAAKKVQS